MDISQMTDEQIMAASEPPADATSSMEESVDVPDADDKESDNQEQNSADDNADAQNNDDTPGEEDPEADAEGNPAEGADDAGEEQEKQEVETDPADKNAEADKPDDKTLADAKAQLDKIFAPFIANGKEIKIDNVDDAIRLMQMGAGFNKKMAALKPHLKIVKMLDSHGLLDEGKLNHLIDISKNNPDAISKLLADSKIDPLNLKPSTDYKPNSYTVDDSEIEFDNVIEDLKPSKHYAKTLEVIVDKWDKASSQILVSNPQVIRDIHDHVASGIYDLVSTEVDRQRALGRLTGLNDLQAYKLVGDQMDQAGAFAKAQETPKSNPTVSIPANASDDKLKSRKLAASPTKSSPGKKVDVGGFNPLTATDEEIKNMSLDKFL